MEELETSLGYVGGDELHVAWAPSQSGGLKQRERWEWGREKEGEKLYPFNA